MKFEEFIGTCYSEVGNRVWVCDYRHNDVDKKAIRHVEPKEVVIFSNHSLSDRKRVYYSDIHFRPIGSKGKVLSQIIAPFDNTGYRAFTGTSLNVFLTKEDCVEHYIKQSEKVKAEIANKRESINAQLDKMTEEIENRINKLNRTRV